MSRGTMWDLRDELPAILFLKNMMFFDICDMYFVSLDISINM